MSERLLVTMRRTPLRSVENVRRSIAAGTQYCSPMELLDSIIDHFGEVITRLSERIGTELDKAEERLWDNASGDESMLVARSRNQVVRVHRQLSQLRELFHRLEHRVAAPLPELSAAVQAIAQKVDAFDNSVAGIHDRARLLQEEIAARMADVTNRRLLTLSVLTATFLPPTLVTGFFGMNTKDLPFQNTDGGTWYAFAVAALAGGLTYWIVSRLR